jgi:O-antigen ligase
VTSLLDAEAPAAPAAQPGSSWHERLEHVLAIGLLLWWLGPMTRSTGGKGGGAVLGALLLSLALILVVRRRVAVSSWVLMVAVLVAGPVVGATAPSGWYGADALASYAAAALTLSGLRAYARSAQRREAVVALVCVAGLLQFAEGFLAWWGGQDPARPMVGTFYFWNPFAAFLLPGALLGVALAVAGNRPWRLIGWLAAPLCAAGVVFSSSRASTALLIAGMVALTPICVDGAVWRGRAVRFAAVLALSVTTVFLLSGPPFFSHRAAPTSAAEAKAASGQSVETNSAYRVGFMRAAVAVTEDRPAVGAGPHGFAAAARPLVPAGTARSNLVHNGYLQPLVDGGLVLGLPFLAAAAGLVLAGTRRVLSARRSAEERVLRLALPVALGAGMAHAAVDVDWSYGSDLLLTAVLGGLVLALGTTPRTLTRTVGRVLVVPLVALTGLLTAALWTWNGATADLNAGGGSAATQAAALRAEGSGPLHDYRYGRAVLQLAAGRGFAIRPGGVASNDIRWALSSTSRQAGADATTQVARARGLVVLGDDKAALALVNGLLAEYGPQRSAGLAPIIAPVLAAAGESPAAQRLLLGYLVASPSSPFAGAQLQVLLQILPGTADDLKSCVYALVPSSAHVPNTPDPGAPGSGVDCTAVL